MAQARGAGIFVLVKTSNPGGKRFQDIVSEGRPLYRHVADYVEQLAAATVGDSGYGIVGAVVGATYPQQLAELRQAMPHTWLLDSRLRRPGRHGPRLCRGLRRARPGRDRQQLARHHLRPRSKDYQGKFGPAQWQEAVEAATREMIAQLRADTPAGRLLAGALG